MKNWLGIMIIIGVAGCQVADTPPPTESSTVQDVANGDICSGVPHYCKQTLPGAQWWTTLPASTSTTVAFIDKKSSPGYWWIYGADPIKGAVLWVRLAVPSQQGASVVTGLDSLAAGFMDFQRPPPCNTCPVGDGLIAAFVLETARIKLGLPQLVSDTVSACFP